MNALTVGYRFSRTELSTLLQALRIGALPGAPLTPVDADAAGEALQRLSDEGMVMLVDGTLYIDRLIDYLLRAAAGSRSAAALTDGKRTLVLWKAERMYLLGDFPEQGDCSLTPLQNAESAQTALADAILRTARPLWAISVSAPERRINVPEDSKLRDREIACSLMELL